jgi:hypothetical protein
MNDEQFQAAIAGTTEQRDAQARQVINGFVLAGNRRFLEPNGAVRVQQSLEAVADTGDAAGAALARFLTTGTFNA